MRVAIGLGLSALLSIPALARAQSAAPAPQSIAAGSQSTPPVRRAPVGDTPLALSGLYRVGVLDAAPAHLSAALAAGYGYTEPIGADTGPHHRVLGSLSLAFAPTTWFDAAFRFNGRYDKHPSDAYGRDDGYVFDDRLVLRASAPLARGLRVGPQLGLWFPSERFKVDTRAITPALRALLSWVPSDSPWLVSLSAGYRLDRSRYSVPEPQELRRGDRTALGVSQFNAVLLGLGGAYRFRRTELLAEATADILVGSGAPSLTKSPLRAAIGARYHFAPLWSAQLIVEGSASQRPSRARTAPLVPVEPRVTALAALNFRLPLHHAGKVPPSAPPPSAPPPAPPPANSAPKATLSLSVVDESGVPLPGASVTASSKGARLVVKHPGDGRFVVKNVPPGVVTLTVQADGFAPATEHLSVSNSQSLERSMRIQMKRALPQGQLRGLVRSFRGKPLQARILVEPTDKTATADEKGFFQIDVPPGRYTVKITADGYERQVLHVAVQKDGVTILNAELRRGR